MKTRSKKWLRFFDSVSSAIESLSQSKMYKNFTNKTFNMYQIPRGEILGVTYIPSKLHKGKQVIFKDIDGAEIDINVSQEKENAIWEILLGIDRNYSSLSDKEMAKVNLWFIMGGGNKEQAICEIDKAAPFMVLLGVNWDGKWVYHDKNRAKTMKPETLKSINNQRIFYLDQFVYNGKPGNFNLTYPHLAQDEVRCFMLNDKISSKVTAVNTPSSGYAVICIPEAPFYFQRPDKFWFAITNHSNDYITHGSNSRKNQI